MNLQHLLKTTSIVIRNNIVDINIKALGFQCYNRNKIHKNLTIKLPRKLV